MIVFFWDYHKEIGGYVQEGAKIRDQPKVRFRPNCQAQLLQAGSAQLGFIRLANVVTDHNDLLTQ